MYQLTTEDTLQKGEKANLTNQVSQGTLIERIGIDKSVITGFTLRNIDDDLFEKKQKEVKGTMYYVPSVWSDLKIKDGRRIGELRIDDKDIGNLYMKSTGDGSSGERSGRSQR